MTTSNNTVFIYALQRISDKTYLYIGSSKNPQKRFYAHKVRTLYPVIQEAFSRNDIRFVVITSTDEAHRIEKEAQLWEQFISAGHPIVNRDPTTIKIGYGLRTVSDETRMKLSKALTGKLVSEETRRKIGEAGRGRTASAETRRRLSEAKKGKKKSEETRAKMSEVAKSRPPMSDETRRKISETKRRNRGK